MRKLMNLLIAAGLVSGGYAAGTIDTTQTPNNCRPPFTQIAAGPVPTDLASEEEAAHLVNVSVLVCRLADGSEVSIFSDGRYVGYDAVGNTIPDAKAFYEAAR